MKTKLLLASSLFLLPVVSVQSEQAHAAEVSVIKSESDVSKYNKALNSTEKTALTQRMVDQFNAGRILDMKKVNIEFIKLINADRKRSGVAPIAYNPKLQAGANQRAQEMAATKVFSHYRPNGMLFNTVFQPEIRKSVKAENALFTYYNGNAYTLVSEKYIAQRLYNQWYKSPSHRKNMLNKLFKGTAVSFKYSKVTGSKYTYGYAVQVINK
ncbi:CAP domain-containing protein [Macrococcus capreoli]